MGRRLFRLGDHHVLVEGGSGRVFVDGQGPVGVVFKSDVMVTKWIATTDWQGRTTDQIVPTDPSSMFQSQKAGAYWLARRYLEAQEGGA